MKTQKEALTSSEITTDEIPGYTFRPEDEALLAVAEGFALYEWQRACGVIGLKSTVEAIPENYVRPLQLQGQWTLDYPDPKTL